MKKITAFIFALIITVFSFSSCKSENEIQNQRLIEYRTFEESLKNSVHGIVIAEFKSSEGKNAMGSFEYKFKIKETLYGEDLGKEIIVSSLGSDIVDVSGTDISYSINETPEYKKGEEYILLLSKFRSVYNEGDGDLISIPSSQPFLPLSDLTQSKMYNEPITKHSHLTENDLNPETLIAYIKDIKKDDTKVYWGNEYIHSGKLEDIVIGSDYIIELEVGEEVDKDASPVTDAFKCTFLKSYKGDFSIDGNEREILFLQGTVKTGKKYIVCFRISDDGKGIRLAAKKGVYSVGKADKIEEILKNAPAQ